jgi:hypothetical protein
MDFTREISRTAIFGISLIVLVIGFLIWVLFFSNGVLKMMGREKIWAHRVNTLGKYQEAITKFPGIEIDVVFMPDEGIFDVTHPPSPSNNLNLEMYFVKGYHQQYQVKYWLDFKNLNNINVKDALNRLTYLCREHHISPGKVIVESKQPGNLNYFKNEKFNTSYYLPQHLATLGDDELEKKIEEIRDKLYPGIDYISTDFRDYRVIDKYFPDHSKLIWFTGYRHMNRWTARFWLFKILKDEKVDGLLMPF